MWQGIVQNFKLANSGFVVHTKLLFPFIRVDGCNIQWNLEKQPRSGHLTFHQSLTKTRTSKLFRNNFVSENFSYSRRLSIRIAENLYSLLSNTYFFLIDFRCSTAVPFHSFILSPIKTDTYSLIKLSADERWSSAPPAPQFDRHYCCWSIAETRTRLKSLSLVSLLIRSLRSNVYDH